MAASRVGPAELIECGPLASVWGTEQQQPGEGDGNELCRRGEPRTGEGRSTKAYRVGIFGYRSTGMALAMLCRAELAAAPGPGKKKRNERDAGGASEPGRSGAEEASQGPRLPVTAARRMRWWMVRAVIEGEVEQREGGGQARAGVAGQAGQANSADARNNLQA